MSEVEQLERKLRQQQIESEKDSLWLAEEEINLVNMFSIIYVNCFLMIYAALNVKFVDVEKKTFSGN